MAKFNLVNHETFQSWYVYMQDLMSQKQSWHQMVGELPARNMSAGSHNHKVLDICENFAEGLKLAVELCSDETSNNVCFYLVDKESGRDDGTHFLCGERWFDPGKFIYTNNKFASDVAGSLLSYLKDNGFITC